MPTERKKSEGELLLMDDPNFNRLIERKLENSDLGRLIKLFLKRYKKDEAEIDDEIEQFMSNVGIDLTQTVEANIEIKYSPNIEFLDKKLASKHYSIRKFSEEIDGKKILRDWKSGLDMVEYGIQVSEKFSVSCLLRRGKAKGRDKVKQDERLKAKYNDG